MPDEIEPNLKPYLLQPSGANLNSIMDSIQHKVEAINRIAHTGAIRTTKQQVSSGIALQTEFELLNARLSEKADNLEIAEEQIFSKEVDKEIVRAVIDDDEKLTQAFDEIDGQAEVGQFTQDEVQEEDVEEEEV